MEFIIEYWYMFISLVVVLVVAGLGVYAFVKQPSSKQMDRIKAWLLLAVVQAEVEMGSGTGQLKLRYVYDLFMERFKWTSKLITFEAFSLLVDGALKEMRELLEKNIAVELLVEANKWV